MVKKEFCECGCSKDKHDKEYPRLCLNCENCEGYTLNNFDAVKKQGAVETLIWCIETFKEDMITEDSPEVTFEKFEKRLSQLNGTTKKGDFE